MAAALLALALLAAPAPDEPPTLTAGQLYDGCTHVLAHGPPAQFERGQLAEAYCKAIAAIDVAAADVLRQLPDGQASAEPDQFCLPEGSDAAALQHAFIAYVDAHPEVRSEEAMQVFDRAIAEKWPCPR